MEARFGLFFHSRGRLEPALAHVDRGIKQIENKPMLFRPVFRSATSKAYNSALAARVLILSEMGRYSEARQTSVKLEKASGSTMGEHSTLALLEMKCGKLDEALAMARKVPEHETQYDAMRNLMSMVYGLKGDFEQAKQSLIFDPNIGAKYDNPGVFESLKQNVEGAKWIQSQKQKLAGIFPPARWIRLAHVYLAEQDFEQSDKALDNAEKSLGSNQILESVYWRARARTYAGQYKSKEAEDCIDRARVMAQKLQSRSAIMETHLAIGRSYLSLRRWDEALIELLAAERTSLHPIERHQANYWIAHAYGSSDRLADALPYYQKVASDPIASWMQREAAAACG
jgi:tetratricopeptide (TPR) repeat protein